MRIYLAGPEVFLPDPASLGAAKKAICARHGLAGVFPLDPPAPMPTGPADWRRIHAACEMHMHGCDALVANLTPFRGSGTDPGTAFELGYMRSMGRPVFGYTHAPGDYRARVEARHDGAAWRDPAGMEVEDFGLAENLMLEGAIAASGGMVLRAAAPLPWTDLSLFEACVAEAARRLSAS
ncbi:nucleoside 2-deoxyribosyltransferase [Roseococcus sp. SYP-B2431]|uniref:nucleoside 2-deoxyribosyltransferase n=1 Tax=Roseococcus sp. SYP-B2431 TaxID=2496640 RepID=UPI00103D0683|nr:nucleoside 2-deoxyribosyltransferase [Roseococcus sp. SYP-B2431]TCH97061.1 nucleoside 2-deoxyribosyltransferase [Roseococcus sp. SYP-B2431]